MSSGKLKLLLVLLMFVWGSAFVAVAVALRELSAANLTALRFFMAALVFLPFIRVPPSSSAGVSRAADIGRFVLLGLFGVVIYHLALNYSETLTTATVASVMATLTPIFTAVLAAAYLSERLSIRYAIGLLVALAGSLVVIASSASEGIGSGGVLGPLLAAVPPLSWAFYTIIAKPMLQRYSPWQITVNSMVAGAILLLPIVAGDFTAEVSRLSPQGWLVMLDLSLGATVFGYGVWNFALRQWEAAELAVWTYLIPLFTAMAAIPLLGEKITPLLGIGAVLIIVGVEIVERQRHRGPSK